MRDPAVSSTRTAPALSSSPNPGARWLLLIHQIPAEPAYLRVKVLRRLKGLGAAALKNTVYLLPDRDACREDFEWVIREIVAGGGSATLCSSSFIEGTTDGELRALFDVDRDREYAELMATAAEALKGSPSRTDADRLVRALHEIRGRDHFQAAGGANAERAVTEVEAAVRPRRSSANVLGEPGRRPSGATWTTRAAVFVDRMASAWLIRRFIDARARFRFVPPDEVPGEDEIAYDMFHGGYTHEGDRCTFETLVARFGLDAPGLAGVAEIVHDIDCKDGKFGRSEAAGVASVLRGIVAVFASDQERIERAAPFFDALLASSADGAMP